ncbi:hypothetical protein L1267_23155 [Pseudoalteromonas sp. OFAV1]|uniref:hypothetical protein n=1 Tax=Pseudoalteromonas sp. OFAV1 TaxID=2908892 RepID=UPI001F172CCD|nr:hypothetical protein [Pseudoalteromonas sp. OFAV1]MCF2903270.1 hypothetical protein [Pseudoalteromonas sp. OFAV1]
MFSIAYATSYVINVTTSVIVLAFLILFLIPGTILLLNLKNVAELQEDKDKIIEIFSKVSTNEESKSNKFQKMLSGLSQIAEKVVNDPELLDSLPDVKDRLLSVLTLCSPTTLLLYMMSIISFLILCITALFSFLIVIF